MAIITTKQSIEKRLLLTFFVSFSLFFSENLFSQDFSIKDYVKIAWNAEMKRIEISATIYNYSWRPRSGHARLQWCRFEASVDRWSYFPLMNIYTHRQNKKEKTNFFLTNKLKDAKIQFLNTDKPEVGKFWPEGKELKVEVYNNQYLAKVSLAWHVGSCFGDVNYIRISGTWQTTYPYLAEPFVHVVYDIKRPGQSMFKSNTPDIHSRVSKSDPAKVLKDSDAIVIKGADSGVNIKVYSTTGTEIKSVISNNDIVKIKLPANQIYFVHIGKSRYKVAL